MSQPRMGTLDFVAHTNPKGLALGDGKRSRSWDAWSQRASALGRYLRDTLGIEEGQRVAWMLPNGLAYYDL